jgi:XRE family transcriptional regulator, master regulator for biofilm formation
VPDNFHREIAKRIQQAAKRKGWTITSVADFAGVSRGQMSYISRATRSPTVRTLRKIAKALDLETRDLIPPEK